MVRGWSKKTPDPVSSAFSIPPKTTQGLTKRTTSAGDVESLALAGASCYLPTTPWLESNAPASSCRKTGIDEFSATRMKNSACTKTYFQVLTNTRGSTSSFAAAHSPSLRFGLYLANAPCPKSRMFGIPGIRHLRACLYHNRIPVTLFLNAS
jgi:hypothetical protein